MNLIKELQKIYESEINFSIECFWDGGFVIKLGDEMNGYVAEDTFSNLEEGVYWLIEQVTKHYPLSKYAKQKMKEKLIDFLVEYLSEEEREEIKRKIMSYSLEEIMSIYFEVVRLVIERNWDGKDEKD